jgi:hypothetical protein
MSQPITLQQFHDAQETLLQSISELLASFSMEHDVIITDFATSLDLETCEYTCVLAYEPLDHEPEPEPEAA